MLIFEIFNIVLQPLKLFQNPVLFDFGPSVLQNFVPDPILFFVLLILYQDHFLLCKIFSSYMCKSIKNAF